MIINTDQPLGMTALLARLAMQGVIISADTIRALERRGVITVSRDSGNRRSYTAETMAKIIAYRESRPNDRRMIRAAS